MMRKFGLMLTCYSSRPPRGTTADAAHSVHTWYVPRLQAAIERNLSAGPLRQEVKRLQTDADTRHGIGGGENRVALLLAAKATKVRRIGPGFYGLQQPEQIAWQERAVVAPNPVLSDRLDVAL
jgi:hypothetical protein